MQSPRRFAGWTCATLAASLCLLAWPSPARACGTASCSLSTRTDDALPARGRLTVDISFRSLQQDRRMDGSGPVQVFGAAEAEVLRPRVDFENGRVLPAYHHEWEMTGGFTQLDIGYGAGSRVALQLSMPLYNRRTVDHLFYPGTGAPTHAHSATTITREKLTLGGLGDVQLGARVALGRRWEAGLGVKAPTGPYRELDEYSGIADPVHQPGSGAWGALASAQYRTGLGWRAASAAVSAVYQRSFENPLRYRFGDERFLTGRVSVPLWSRVTASMQVKAYHAARSEYRGEPTGSTGAFVVYLAPGLRFKAPAGMALYGNVQLPVYQHVNENQLGVRLVTQVGVSRSF